MASAPVFIFPENSCLRIDKGVKIMIAVAVNKMKKIYGGSVVLEDITFSIQEGERIGFIGRNGEGKSTILKIIAGIEAVDAGDVFRKKQMSIGMLDQIPEAQADESVEEFLLAAFSELLGLQRRMHELEVQMAVDASERVLNQYALVQSEFIELGGYQIESEMARILNGLEIADLAGQRFASLSGGERTKVALAQLLLQQPDLLLLDEPTNHLDLAAVLWLTNFVKNYKGTCFMVSHDRYFLDDTVQRIFELDNKTMYEYTGNYSAYLVEREARILREFQEYKDQQKKIAKMKQAIKRLREWAIAANPPNAALFRRAKNMEKALARIELVKKPNTAKPMNLQFESGKRSGKDVLIFEAVSKQFGDKIILAEVDLQVRYGERVALIGENGAGKSTILRLALGTEAVDTGQAQLGSQVKLAYLSQDFVVDSPKQRVIDFFRERVLVDEGKARHLLAQFLFYGDMVYRRVSDLSGGEQMRLRFAAFVNQPVNMLILDEPTNHLDIASREVLEEAIKNFAGTIICVSHDRYFIDQLCDRVLWLDQGMLTSYPGNYSYAYQKRLEQEKAGR